MLGSVLNRFRIALLLMAFSLGLAAQVISGVAMAGQMQSPSNPGMTAGTMCPGCATDQEHGGMSAGCTVAACWMVPGLPAQSTIPAPPPRMTFITGADITVAGIASAPDPYPPRFSLHS